MRSFTCPGCGQTLFFENSVCLGCGQAVGYSRTERTLLLLGDTFTPCLNLDLNGCNWIPDVAGEQCFACSLTRTRPADGDLEGLPQYYLAEQAKRRLVDELDRLELPVRPRDEATGRGVTFDLLSSVAEDVVTGHADGVITIDLAEGDSAHREKVKDNLGEAYRTLLGHFRHEIGHYYWQVLVEDPAEAGDAARREDFRARFGDETASYQDAIDRHYSVGPPEGWEESYVSAYATMHPWEDFAETFAHVLHIGDALETAHAFGLTVDPQVALRRFSDVVVGTWLPLSTALNQMNRSMGLQDLYPFVLAPAVLDKLEWVEGLISGRP
ncbi:zinc-binding metallopeptidase family protein [Nocardioides marmoribigeumensis]|uniref:Zinc-ribbon domain-containing protein n=1 Tax=Nocardioides marmoribigeumensis TaxID=433649 RepID=A0ABU2BUB9_9ACTN|nr:putative zinc-binding metallopeptidase [Nocardioides marmoribigeumensis]MDR7362223.1 hypothetical protein [Nocardioides marmoribigeumensis]